MTDYNTIDWKKLRAWVAERKPVRVQAGLVCDWFWTAATVFENGKWVRDHRAYTMSYWATAGFEAEMANGDVVKVPCNKKATKREVAAFVAARERRMKKYRETSDIGTGDM